MEKISKPKVSVIIPCYNHINYVSKSVESVISQSYSNIELIVIDDGSTDGSVDILANMAKAYNFVFVAQENNGVCKTLNKAINEYATGDFIAILASDDYWHKDKIEKQILELRVKSKSEFCFTKAVEFDSDTGRKIRIFPNKPLTGNILNEVFIRQHVPAGSILFTKKLFDYVGGFDEDLKEEDWDFVIRCAAVTEFSAVNEPLFFYRSHELNTMKTSSRRKIFHQKVKVLSKNYLLVSPSVWGRSILLHYLYDHIVVYLNLSYLKKLFNS